MKDANGGIELERMTVGERLRAFRLRAGLSQSRLAQPRYSHAYVSTIEGGRRVATDAALSFFAKKLGVDVEELRTGRPPELPARLELDLQQARRDLSHGSVAAALSTFQEIEDSARHYGLTRLEARAIVGRAMAAERSGDVERATDLYEQAEKVLADEPLPVRADAVAGKARCLQMLGDIRYTIHILESAVSELERGDLTEPNALMRLHASLVAAYFETGLYEKAAASARIALSLVPEVSDPETLAGMHVNVARVFLQEGRIEDAIGALHRAEDIYGQLDLLDKIAIAHFARGYVLGRTGDLEGARSDLITARAMLERTNSPLDEARVLNELARLERVLGNFEAARDLATKAVGKLRDGDRAELAQAQRELGLTLLDTDAMKAEKHLREAIQLYEAAEETVELAATYRSLGDLLRSRGDEVGAGDLYRAGILVLEERL